MNTRLRALHSKAAENGHWPLMCALTVALGDESTIDHRINVIGAMHEVGLLRNSMQPLWAGWRTDAAAKAWADRCIERLLVSDHDYWALTGLLGLPLMVVRAALTQSQFSLLSVRFAKPLKGNELHIATLSRTRSDRVIAPVLEVGWDTATGEVQDMSRWRAVILEQHADHGGNLVGHGNGSYFIRATLPHGGWRIVADEFRLQADWCVPREQSLMAGY